MKTVILHSEQIEKITKRIALQVIEACHNEPSIVVAGILPRGQWVAAQVITHLKTMTKTPVTYFDIDPDRPETVARGLGGKCVVLADDIVNSGLTMMKSAALVTLQDPSRLLTVCLVDRKHRQFPISVDFTGLSLATTMREHLSLKVGSKPEIVLE